LIPAFGHLYLSALKRRDIREWASWQNVSNKRIANLLSPLRVALQEAVDDELIEANPLYGWSFRRREKPKQGDDVDPFSTEEQNAIMRALTGQGRNLVQFAFWTGLRTSELVALEWDDIDWHRDTVRVSRACTQAATEAESPKTRSSMRDVKLLPLALAALQAQREHSTFHDSGRIFLNPRTSEPWTGDQPIRRTLWGHALRRAGVRYRRPYQTRHTYASMMLSAGESPLWVAQQMGHADWTMIARVYGRWIPDADPEAGAKATKVFGAAPGTVQSCI
jgi:integrase